MKLPSVADTAVKPGIGINAKRLSANDKLESEQDPAQVPHSAQSAASGDTVSISPDARDAAKLTAMLEQHRKQTEESGAAFDEYAKCLKIAMRIMNGDLVPLQDIRFLGEREPELLESAMLLRRHNEDPEKHDSVLDEEKNAAGGNPLLGATAPTAQSEMAAESEENSQ